MSEIQFSDNYNDLSTDTGFQFEFHCENCGERWRSEFDRYAAGTAENLLGAAEGMFGGIFGTARNALGHVKSAGWSKAKDVALRKAVEQAKQHFHRCPRCANHFCDNCWNPDEGTCVRCVPRLDPEIAAINREAKLARAREVAYNTATVSKEDMEQKVVSCPSCGAANARGKFCSECGEALSQSRTCQGCSAQVPAGAKFCPECGEKAA